MAGLELDAEWAAPDAAPAVAGAAEPAAEEDAPFTWVHDADKALAGWTAIICAIQVALPPPATLLILPFPRPRC